MKRFLILLGVLTFAGTVQAQGDASIRTAQQTLKDQGFYYGEITGRTDADTTAAIRRYQIRNGLQITGELNAQTQKSLGVRASAAPQPVAPARSATPRAMAPAPRAQESSELQDDSSPQREPSGGEPWSRPVPPSPGYATAPGGAAPALRGVFEGTPFEGAPPDVQRRVIVGAQSLLMREGIYRSGIDGIYGPGTQYALRAFQSRYGLEPNGLLDMETMNALGLLPGQQTRGFERRRTWRGQQILRTPGGERIFIPRG
ncbi:MAG: peptidoglycan-binding protein [Chthoniobacterales bacterium]